jgi:hypothetical protein
MKDTMPQAVQAGHELLRMLLQSTPWFSGGTRRSPYAEQASAHIPHARLSKSIEIRLQSAWLLRGNWNRHGQTRLCPLFELQGRVGHIREPRKTPHFDRLSANGLNKINRFRSP